LWFDRRKGRSFSLTRKPPQIPKKGKNALLRKAWS